MVRLCFSCYFATLGQAENIKSLLASKRFRRYETTRLCQLQTEKFHDDFPNAMEIYTNSGGHNLTAIVINDSTVPPACSDPIYGECTLSECLQLCYDTAECAGAVWRHEGITTGHESCSMKSNITHWEDSSCTPTLDNPCWITAIKCNYDLSSIIGVDQFSMADYAYTGDQKVCYESHYIWTQCNDDGNREGYISKDLLETAWKCKKACDFTWNCRKAEFVANKAADGNSSGGTCWLWDKYSTPCPGISMIVTELTPESTTNVTTYYPSMTRCFVPSNEYSRLCNMTDFNDDRAMEIYELYGVEGDDFGYFPNSICQDPLKPGKCTLEGCIASCQNSRDCVAVFWYYDEFAGMGRCDMKAIVLGWFSMKSISSDSLSAVKCSYLLNGDGNPPTNAQYTYHSGEVRSATDTIPSTACNTSGVGHIHCPHGWMCNLDNDNNGQCKDCVHEKLFTVDDCITTGFTTEAGTNECIQKCTNGESKEATGDGISTIGIVVIVIIVIAGIVSFVIWFKKKPNVKIEHELEKSVIDASQDFGEDFDQEDSYHFNMIPSLVGSSLQSILEDPVSDPELSEQCSVVVSVGPSIQPSETKIVAIEIETLVIDPDKEAELECLNLVNELLLDFNETANRIDDMFYNDQVQLSEKGVEMVKEILSFYTEYDILLQSTTNRNIDQIRSSIREIEIRRIVEKLRVKYKATAAAQQLEDALEESKQIRKKFDDMEKMKKKIQQLKQSVISEIRSYGSPPDGVHQVMMATYILLGQRRRDVESWKQLQARLGKSGTHSLKRRIQNHDVNTMQSEWIDEASELLKDVDLAEMGKISDGAAVFYSWCLVTINAKTA